MVKKIATILFFSLLVVIPGQGQEGNTPEDRYLESTIERRSLDRNRWADLTEGIDYTEKKRQKAKPSPDQETPVTNENPHSIFGEGTGSAIARFLLIVLGAIAIALLMKSILGYGQAKDKKIRRTTEEQIDIQKIEENIHEADLDDFIGQAKAAKDFNLAIRLYYLSILKELSLLQAIKWKVDKTNNEYLREMREHELITEFRELTGIFERSWYGDRPLDLPTFERLEPGFEQFINRLSIKTALTS